MELIEGFVICDVLKKEQILKELNQTDTFKDYIFLTLKELEEKIYGKCTPESIFELMRQYGLSLELTKEYVKYIPYVEEEKEYNNLKLDSLVSAKRFLIQKGLFQKDKFFLFRLRQYPITFVDIDENIQVIRLKKILSQYTKVLDVQTKFEYYQPKVYYFKDIYDEVLFVCNQIVDLLHQGIEANQIYLCNIDSDYTFLLERVAKHYNIPISLPKKKNINSLPIAKKFLNLCNEMDSFHDILKELDSNSKYYHSIFDIIVHYNLEECNPKEFQSFFYEQFKNIAFMQPKYEMMVKTTQKTTYLDTDYVFYLGLNLGSVPKVYKDDAYLSDVELYELSLLTSAMKNKIAKEELKNLLLGTKNITITYKKLSGSEECFPANCIEEYQLEVCDGDVLFGYSEIEDKVRLGISYTRFLKYKEVDDNLKEYDLSDLNYQIYDNKYKRISPKLLEERFKLKPLKMAYSNIKIYFACPFSYFADRILGLNEFKPNMAARLGTFSHAVLEDSYKNDFNFEGSCLKYRTEYALDSKDKFYFTIMEEVLNSLISYNRRHEELSMLDQVEREAHIVYEEDEFSFEGFIDKLLYAEINGEIYAAIIDYKTGKDIISLDNVTDGFHLQLPSYMFLLSKYEKFKNKKIHILGIYLQKVNIIALDNTIDIVAQREKSFKLQGFSISDRNLLAMLEPSYAKSDYIMGMSILKSGEFSRFAKLVSEEDQKELIQIVDDLIHRANQEIRDAKFEIAPKLINNKNESCMFCKYKDICYMKYEDLVELEEKPFPRKEEE